MNTNIPVFLFVCVENACRSQMAEGLLNHLTQKARAISAGTKPSKINPMAIEVMRERGIDITEQTSKLLTPALSQKATKIITMGCMEQCPLTPTEKTITWNISDPKGKEKAFFLSVRDEIEKEILLLIKNYSLS